jgi:hypothetical protein
MIPKKRRIAALHCRGREKASKKSVTDARRALQNRDKFMRDEHAFALLTAGQFVRRRRFSGPLVLHLTLPVARCGTAFRVSAAGRKLPDFRVNEALTARRAENSRCLVRKLEAPRDSRIG